VVRASLGLVPFRILLEALHAPLLKVLRRIEREEAALLERHAACRICLRRLEASTIDVTIFTHSRCAALAPSKSSSATPNASRNRSSFQ
jgi:hypothetical protein